MSQARAISRPPPKAAPSMAAMVGTGRLPGREQGTIRDMNWTEKANINPAANVCVILFKSI